jgi:hypothetical protein
MVSYCIYICKCQNVRLSTHVRWVKRWVKRCKWSGLHAATGPRTRPTGAADAAVELSTATCDVTLDFLVGFRRETAQYGDFSC